MSDDVGFDVEFLLDKLLETVKLGGTNVGPRRNSGQKMANTDLGIELEQIFQHPVNDYRIGRLRDASQALLWSENLQILLIFRNLSFHLRFQLPELALILIR